MKIIKVKAKFRKPVHVKLVSKSKEEPDVPIRLNLRNEVQRYKSPRIWRHRVIITGCNRHINNKYNWNNLVSWRRRMGIWSMWRGISITTPIYASWTVHRMAWRYYGHRHHHESISGIIFNPRKGWTWIGSWTYFGSFSSVLHLSSIFTYVILHSLMSIKQDIKEFSFVSYFLFSCNSFNHCSADPLSDWTTWHSQSLPQPYSSIV